MMQTTRILSVVALILLFVNYKKTGKHMEGLKSGLKQMVQTIPIIACAFIMAGMIEVLIPVEFVQNWLSREAGLKGIVLGTFGGMLLAVGPYAAFPITTSILVSGAGLGTIVSIITGWSLLGLLKAPYEIAFFGSKFFISRMLYSIPFCLAAGLIAHLVEVLIL